MKPNLRLQVALAQLGFASRRGAAEIIKSGRVRLNDRVIVEPGQRVNLEKDTITVDGKTSCSQKLIYLILNKPKGVVTTVKDKYAARAVLDLIQLPEVRIYPVGRLDKDTTGLLLLTNDGPLAYRLTHPKFGVKKVYRVSLHGCPSLLKLKKIERGIVLEGKKTYPCQIKVIIEREKTAEVEVQLTEGRKRQIKKMFAVVGHPVLSIQRIAFGPLRLGELKTGHWRALTPKERTQLKRWN